VQVDVGEEQVHAVEGDVVRDPDVADVSAWPGSPDGLHHRLLRANGLDHRVRTQPVGELLDRSRTGVATLADDVGGTKLARELLARLVPAHRDDPFGSELLGGHDTQQADRAVADHDDGLARTDRGGHGGEPAGSQDVGGGKEIGDHLVVRYLGGGHEGAVGEGDAHPLSLCAVRCAGLAGHTQEDCWPARQISQVLSEATKEPTTNWPV
jgi:hypothetical protein